jgi:glyoxylase-like metal-dependent hydrolase (beta-lactamase superfamily II)
MQGAHRLMPVGALFRACDNILPLSNTHQREISMHRFQAILHLILALVVGAGLSGQATAQGNQFQGVELSIEPVAGNVYMVKRPGGSFAPQAPVAGRPVITFNDEMSFHLNGEQVRVFLAPPAHTDGDVFVYFTESDVLHLGDVFRTTSYPIIDKYNGGSLRGTIAALDLAIDLAGPATRVIPGHGLGVVGREQMIEFRDMILDVQSKVYTMIRDGKHLAEVMAAQPTAEYDAQWGQEAGWTATDFVPVVYYELGGAGRLLDR